MKDELLLLKFFLRSIYHSARNELLASVVLGIGTIIFVAIHLHTIYHVVIAGVMFVGAMMFGLVAYQRTKRAFIAEQRRRIERLCQTVDRAGCREKTLYSIREG